MEKKFKVQANLRLIAGEKAFGPGIVQLLEGIDELGSLRRSAAKMNMSYNKAWHILRDCDERLGLSLLERRTGGAGGGGAELTAEGREMVRRYRAFEIEARESLDHLVEKYFGSDIWENQ